MIKKIFQQTSWQVLGKVVTSLSTFIILGLVTRNYGEEGTGIFTLALTYLAIFYLLSDFGFNAHVLKKLKIDNGQVTIEWQKLLGTRILWSLVLVVLAVGTLPFWPASPRGEPFASGEFSKAVVFGSLAIIGSAIFTTCNLIFQSKLRYDLSVLASSIGTVVGLGIFTYLAFYKYPVSFLMIAHVLSWIVIACCALILIKNKAILPIFDKRYTLSLFKDSWPIAATLSLNVIYFRADSFMIAYFKGISDVGIYNVAYSVFQSILVLPAFVMNSFYPMMLVTLKINTQRFGNQIKLVALNLILIALFITLATYYLSPLIIKLITGAGFTGSVESLKILSLGFPAYFLSALLMWVMVAKKMYKKMLLIYTYGLLINLSLNFIYIPKYSYLAASWITVISEYLILALQVVSLLL